MRRTVVQLGKPKEHHVCSTVFSPLDELSGSGAFESSVVGTFGARGVHHSIRRYRICGAPTRGFEPIKIGLFAGLHGDEPAGCVALVQFILQLVREPAHCAGYDLHIYPVCNPTGLEAATRANDAGKDLNREFWRDSNQPEVLILEQELRVNAFNGIITLHADDTSDGLYGYAKGSTINEALLVPALRAAESVIARNRGTSIDGFQARDGIICDCFKGVLSAPPDQLPQPFDVIFETPALAPTALQVQASVAALETILTEYRGFIALAENL